MAYRIGSTEERIDLRRQGLSVGGDARSLGGEDLGGKGRVIQCSAGVDAIEVHVATQGVPVWLTARGRRRLACPPVHAPLSPRYPRQPLSAIRGLLWMMALSW